jgi:hypothetical protein
MASAAVGRSPVFTPSPSQTKAFSHTSHGTASKTPQRRRSLQSTRTLSGAPPSARAATGTLL